MKKYQLVLMTSAIICGLMSLVLSVGAQPVLIPKSIQKNIQKDKLPAIITVPGNLLKKDIDLAAESIAFSVVGRGKDQYRATVMIEGVVRNVGIMKYVSGANQQSAHLYEDNGGIIKLVATQVFQNLDVNATVKVSFTRSWYKASPAEGEFPPIYILIIGYDPDIYIDGNTNNDDANSNNNKLSKSSSEINRMTFR